MQLDCLIGAGWNWNFKEESPNIWYLVLLLHSVDEVFSFFFFFFLKVEPVLCFTFMFFDAANWKAIKLSCELLRIFITGSSIYNESLVLGFLRL